VSLGLALDKHAIALTVFDDEYETYLRSFRPREDSCVKPAGNFDQSTPGGWMDLRKRTSAEVAIDNPAFLHQYLCGQQHARLEALEHAHDEDDRSGHQHQDSENDTQQIDHWDVIGVVYHLRFLSARDHDRSIHARPTAIP
jgi:hypothetical protein